MTIARDLADVALLTAPSGNNVVFDSTIGLSGGTADGLVYLNASKVATTGSALTFDGTNVATTGNVTLDNAKYYRGKNAAGSAVRLLGVNALNINYVGAIDNGPTEVNYGAASTITTQYWNIAGTETMRLNSTTLNVATNVVPTTTGTRDLGTNLLRFKDLYLSGSNLYIGTKTANLSRTSPTTAPTLNLDFANSGVVDSRVTFNRSTRSTFYNQKGLLEVAGPDRPRIEYDPVTGECRGLLVEESRTNLLLYSDSLLNWNLGATVANYDAAISPSGLFDATLITEVATNTDHVLSRTTAGVTPSSTYTFSAFVKPSGRTTILLEAYSTGGGWVNFNLATGTVVGTTSYGGASGVSGAIQALPNGWFRCSMTITTTASDSNLVSQIRLGTGPYLGVVTSGILVYGCQLELGSFPTSYIPTTPTFTSRASSATYFDSVGTLKIAGVNQPRYGYSYDSASGKWVSSGLILESAATNLISYSTVRDIGSNWQQYVSAVLTENYSVAPDNSNSAGRIVVTTTGTVRIGSSSLLNANRYSASVWLKSNTSSNYTLEMQVGDSTAKAITVTPTWTRYSGTSNPQIDGYNFVDLEFGSNADISVWGLQLELGEVATSYIPTYGSTATRAGDASTSAQTTRVRDLAKISNIDKDNWYNASEGTLFAYTFASQFPPNLDYAGIVSLNSGTSDNVIQLFRNNINLRGEVYSVGKNSSSQYASGPLGHNRASLSYKYNDSSLAVNGTALITDNSVDIPQNITQLEIGSFNGQEYPLNGHIKRLAYYPKKLSDNELTAITQ